MIGFVVSVIGLVEFVEVVRYFYVASFGPYRYLFWEGIKSVGSSRDWVPCVTCCANHDAAVSECAVSVFWFGVASAMSTDSLPEGEVVFVTVLLDYFYVVCSRFAVVVTCDVLVSFRQSTDVFFLHFHELFSRELWCLYVVTFTPLVSGHTNVLSGEGIKSSYLIFFKVK